MARSSCWVSFPAKVVGQSDRPHNGSGAGAGARGGPSRARETRSAWARRASAKRACTSGDGLLSASALVLSWETSVKGHSIPTQDQTGWPYCRRIRALLTWFNTLRQRVGLGRGAGTKREGVRDERHVRACQRNHAAPSGDRLRTGADAVLAADLRAQHP